MKAFTAQVIDVISAIPEGKVMTYGQVAAWAGNPRGARQVSRVLHSMSRKYGLPWFRVINSRGQISLPLGRGADLQKELLIAEGIVFNLQNTVDLKRFALQNKELNNE